MPYALVKQADMYSTASRIYGKITVYVGMLMSTTTVPMTTKRRRVVAVDEVLSPIKLHDPLMTWCEITWQSKNITTRVPVGC